MPSNMAMQRPGAGIIRRELNYDVRVGCDDLDIPTLWIQRVGEGFCRSDPVAGVRCSRGEHKEVVSVKMDWVCCEGGVVDYEADGAVRAEVVDIPLEFVSLRKKRLERGVYLGVIRVRDIPGIGEEENRRIVISAERNPVHGPERITRSVLPKRNVDLLGDGWLRIWGNGKPWDSLVERIL
jgi:hypothetical protein